MTGAIDDIFSHPRKTLRWASEEIDKFELSEKVFLDANPGKEWHHLDFQTCELVYGITFSEKTSDDLERGGYRIVSDLRNALDQTTYAAAKALGGVKLKSTNFPFGESANDFRSALAATKGHYRDIPSELHPILTSFEPYWRDDAAGEGNNVLRGLAQMANPNKHQVPLGVQVQTGMRLYEAMGHITSFGTRWDGHGKTELYRTAYGKPFKIDMQLEPRIAFAKVGVLGGKPALITFREMEASIKDIIGRIEAETRRILGS